MKTAQFKSIELKLHKESTYCNIWQTNDFTPVFYFDGTRFNPDGKRILDELITYFMRKQIDSLATLAAYLENEAFDSAMLKIENEGKKEAKEWLKMHLIRDGKKVFCYLPYSKNR